MREEREIGGQFIGRPPAPDVSLFDPGEVRDYLGFVFRSARRRWKLASAILIVFSSATVGAVALLPRQYRAEARLFAMPADGAPGTLRGIDGEPTGLAQGAAEAIVSYQNLEKLIRDLSLDARWETVRPPLGRLRERAARVLGQPAPDAAARNRALVGYLWKQLQVQVKGGEVTLSFEWPDARTAFEVVRTAQETLLENRRAAELVPLERKLAAAESNAIAAQRRIDQLVAGLQAAALKKQSGARSSSVSGLQAEGRFRDLPDPQLAEQRLRLIAKGKSIAELEAVREKRLSELNAQLAEQKATLGPDHPALRSTQEKIDSLGREGAQVEALKAEQERLLADFVRAGGKEIELSADPSRHWPAELKDDDELVAYGKARVAMELSALQHLLDGAAEAQVALASTKASFDSRYMVVAPAQLPERPVSPKVGLLVAAGILGGVLLALLGAVASDLRGGVIRETWQARRRLDLPVLAEVPTP